MALGEFPELVDPLSFEHLAWHGDNEVRTASGTSYPVAKGIPRVVINRLNYTAAFGEQWNKWRTTQLDSFTRTTISESRLRRCLGPRIVELVGNSSDRSTLDILEVGCGAGRFTEVLLGFPAVRLTSIDLSEAVEANAENFPQTDHHRVIQCDINMAPFRLSSFDIVICLGVIQHTPSPEMTIASLFRQVKPGGYLVLDHYRPEIVRLTKVTALALRPLIKRMSSAQRIRVCRNLVSIFLPLHKAARNHFLVQALLSRLSPITSYYHAYPQLDDSLQRNWADLDTHDSLTDWYKHLRTPAQIQRALTELGATDVEVSVSGHGVEARCTRPS